MPFPAGWEIGVGPAKPSGVAFSIRFFKAGAGTANFEDNAYLFVAQAGANPYPTAPASLYSSAILIRNEGGGDLEFSFDGVNIAGRVPAGAERIYRERHESGIALRGAGINFEVEAW